jgi:hypothetical protein
MSDRSRRNIVIALLALLLATLACAPNIDLPGRLIPDGAQATAEAAASLASSLAETAVAAATSRGAAAIATVQAAGTPSFGSLQSKIEAIRPDEQGNFTVTITEDEVNEAIRLRQLLGNAEIPAQFQSVTIRFSDGHVILRSNLLQPLPAQLEVAFSPMVVDGEVRFQIASASLAGAQVPQALLNTTQGLVSQLLVQGLANLPADVVIENVSVGQGTMTVEGQRGIGP